MTQVLHSINDLLNIAGIIWAHQFMSSENLPFEHKIENAAETHQALLESAQAWAAHFQEDRKPDSSKNSKFDDYRIIRTGIKTARDWCEGIPHLVAEHTKLERALNIASFYFDNAQSVKSQILPGEIYLALDGVLNEAKKRHA
jgi:hypothetical protein